MFTVNRSFKWFLQCIKVKSFLENVNQLVLSSFPYSIENCYCCCCCCCCTTHFQLILSMRKKAVTHSLDSYSIRFYFSGYTFHRLWFIWLQKDKAMIHWMHLTFYHHSATSNNYSWKNDSGSPTRSNKFTEVPIPVSSSYKSNTLVISVIKKAFTIGTLLMWSNQRFSYSVYAIQPCRCKQNIASLTRLLKLFELKVQPCSHPSNKSK